MTCASWTLHRDQRHGRTDRAAAVKSLFFAETPMEAERLNAIANRLQDLQERTGALRRYL